MKTTCKTKHTMHQTVVGSRGRMKRELLPEFKEKYGAKPRRWLDRQALYKRDDTVRCQGCKLLFANLASYLDHALWCEELTEYQKVSVRNGELIQKQRFLEMMKHAN